MSNSNNKRPRDYYKNKRHFNKKKSASSNNQKSNDGNENNDNRVHEPQQSITTCDSLNVHNTYINFKIPYYAWKLFFYGEDYEDDSCTLRKIQTVESFVNRHQRLLSLLSLQNLENGTVFTIDMCEILNDNIFLKEWPDFKTDLYENPLHTLNCFKLAIHQQILRTVPKETLSSTAIINTLSNVRLSILNYQPIILLQDLKANYYGKFICVRGWVTRVGHVEHLAQWIVFRCRKCKLQQLQKQLEGVFKVPTKCHICGVSKFRPVLNSPLVQSISFQTIKIQEISNNDQNSIGSIPRMLDVELMDDLVNICMPGDDITLTGIIKGTNNASKNKNQISFSLYMEAMTIVNNKQKLQLKNVLNNEMPIKDYLAIKEVYNTPNIFPLLVHSLCPSIYGHNMVKAGLLLSLFGGNDEHSDLRENIHILVVGDPGLGKSQMLQSCVQISTKGVYVCGNSSTSSGLTITLTKDKKSNNFALEPGALVLADRGCCCIDEFDKMSKQQAVLLEAMEQQCVSVAKSGIICSLPTRTSILAAANPINGRFDRSKTVMQNLKMSAPLLSRFDLVFLLLDEPNKHMDDLLSKHVMSMHSHLNNEISRTPSILHHDTNVSNTEKVSLKDRLASPLTAHRIPQSILRKYIAYARQYVKPKITEEAAVILQEYYLKLRKEINKFEDLSVCNRQLEAMIRLTEAKAKLELRTEAVAEDASDVIEIFQYTFDNRTISYSPLSTKTMTNSKVKQFINVLKRETASDSCKIFNMKQLQEIALDNRILIDDFSSFITKLNQNGILLQLNRGTFKFVPP